MTNRLPSERLPSPPKSPPAYCPSCGAPIAGRGYVCTVCGGIAPVEASFMGVKRAISRFFERVVSLIKRHPLDWLLWVLALIPLLIGPPALVVFLLLIGVRNDRADRHWLLIVAALNLVLSAMVWMKFAAEIGATGATFFDWLDSLPASRGGARSWDI